jgi:hypothetical protein
MRRWAACFALGLSLLLVGCTRVSNDDVGVPPPNPVADVRMHQQAVDALARWDQAIAGTTGPVFLPVGDSFGQIGQWEPGNERDQDMLAAGRFVFDGDLPPSPSATTQVHWDDGTTATLPMLAAVDAFYDAPRVTSTCDGCGLLHVTGAVLIDGATNTTRGMARIPLWEFGLAGTAVRVTRPAVTDPPVRITPPSVDSTHPPAGTQIDSAVASPDGLTLTVNFIGTGTVADEGPCGSDYAGEAVESDHAVVVIIHELPEPQPLSDPHFACDLMRYLRSTTAELAKPLGDRAVLDDWQGLPVPVTREG